MRKLTVALLAAALALTAAGCSPFRVSDRTETPPESSREESLPPPEPEALDPSTPEGAADTVFRSVQQWDAEALNACLPQGETVEKYVPAALEGTVRQVLGRMEYRIGESEIAGDRALVEVEITAVDTEEALNDAVTAAIAYVAKQQLKGEPVEDYAAVVQAVASEIDIVALPLRTTRSTAHMAMGGDGLWKLDLSTEENLPLLNAATGGAVDIALRVRELAESYGFALS